MYSAIALFVKDEVQDIAAWIAWHLSIGFDKIFIYDDHSTDGTYEICQIFTEFYNVEVFRTDLTIQHFYWRQADSYKKASCKAAGKFDWICFLDSDEYLFLEHAQSVNAFLENFSAFNGIALSWKFYGSNGLVLKSKLPPYEAYTRHCTQEMKDCEIGKLFIRPEDYTLEYSDTGGSHYLKLRNERYANAKALPTNLAYDLEYGIKREPLWENAWINHYAVRSMQDFVEKIQKRNGADLTNNDFYWRRLNQNDVVCYPPSQLVIKSRKIIDFIKIQSVEKFINERYAANLAKKRPETPHSTIYKPLSYHNGSLILEKYSKHPDIDFSSIVSQQFGSSNKDDSDIFCVIYNHNSAASYFFSCVDDQISTKRFSFEGDARLSSSLLFDVKALEDRFGFQCPETKLYLSCSYPEVGGRIEVNRPLPDQWEKFTLEKVENTQMYFIAYPGEVKDEDSFSDYIQKNSGNISYGDFLIAFNQLDILSRKRILSKKSGYLLSWL